MVNTKFNVNDAVKNLHINVEVVGMRSFHFRLWCAQVLFLWASNILGMGGITITNSEDERMKRIENKLDLLLTKEAEMSQTLDEVLKAVNDEATIEDSILTLVSGLKQQLVDALANTTLSAEAQAKVDAIFAQVEANKAKLSAVVVANTPAAPEAPAAPTTDAPVV